MSKPFSRSLFQAISAVILLTATGCNYAIPEDGEEIAPLDVTKMHIIEMAKATFGDRNPNAVESKTIVKKHSLSVNLLGEKVSLECAAARLQAGSGGKFHLEIDSCPLDKARAQELGINLRRILSQIQLKNADIASIDKQLARMDVPILFGADDRDVSYSVEIRASYQKDRPFVVLITCSVSE